MYTLKKKTKQVALPRLGLFKLVNPSLFINEQVHKLLANLTALLVSSNKEFLCSSQLKLTNLAQCYK